MRSLVVFHLGGSTGPLRSLRPLADWLVSQGPVEFVVPKPGPTEREYASLGTVLVRDYAPLTYGAGLVDRLRIARRLGRDVSMFRREYGRRRADLVIVVTTVLPSALAAARLERIPSVVYAAELYEQPWRESAQRRRYGALVTSFSGWAADAVVCCSDAVARQFSPGPEVVVAHPPIGAEYGDGSRERGRSRLGVDPDAPCVVTVGSITRGRGQDIVLHALALVRQRVPTAQLALIGEPHPREVDRGYERELRLLADGLGLTGAVVFAGLAESSEEMADAYAAADVVVNPARFAEPFGRVAPEALRAGRPVVATRVGAIPEVIRDGVDGLVVPPDDPEAMAAAIERLLEEPQLGERLAASGRERVIERFSEAQALAAWVSAIEPILRRRGLR